MLEVWIVNLWQLRSRIRKLKLINDKLKSFRIYPNSSINLSTTKFKFVKLHLNREIGMKAKKD